MLALAHSAAMLGIDGYVVRVEADSAPGTPGFAIIGLPDRAIGEARDRVRAAIVNSGYAFPAGRVLVNLAPADIRKVGPGFDLAIALALLAIDEQVDTLALQGFVALGELALDGTVRPTRGVLPMTIGARNAGFDSLVVPQANVREAGLVDGVTVFGIACLHDAVAIALGHGQKFRQPRGAAPFRPQPNTHGDFADVRGQTAGPLNHCGTEQERCEWRACFPPRDRVHFTRLRSRMPQSGMGIRNAVRHSLTTSILQKFSSAVGRQPRRGSLLHPSKWNSFPFFTSVGPRLDSLKIGLRCQDVHMSLGGIDPNSPDLTTIHDTRFIGMAASIATTIKGQDVIRDARALETIACDQLDVTSYAFPEVIRLLEELGWVGSVEKKGSRIHSFAESIPLHADIYGLLGDAWRDRQPDEFEQSFISGVNRLAMGPVTEEQFADAVGIDRKDSARLLRLAHAADMAKTIVTSDGRVVYSPYYFFENSEQLGPILATHGTPQFQDELQRVRAYQGLPTSDDTPALNDAINRGLIIAPSVLAPDSSQKTFAFLPYTIDPAFYTIKKKILDKALAIVSCVRCGENFGGFNAIHSPVSILNRLLDVNTNFTLKPHSSHKRQYELLFRMQIVDFIPSGNWVSPKLIATDDNIEAVKLARDLILSGEAVSNRDSSADEARDALMNSSLYRSPIETVRSKRDKHVLDSESYGNLFRAAFGYMAL